MASGNVPSLWDSANKQLMEAVDIHRALKRDVVSDLTVAIAHRRNVAELYRQAANFIASRSAPLPLQYKARPLNGIWATAPYLHNGSVPTLYELLLPAAQRSKMFTVGSREFDPVNVGLRSGKEDGPFQFDTSLAGNANSGHEGAAYGTEPGQLNEVQKRELLEYLKTL